MSPNKAVNSKIPAGALPSPSHLCGPSSPDSGCRPSPQPSPERPRTTGVESPNDCHCPPTPARSNRRRQPPRASQPSAVTTSSWVERSKGKAVIASWLKTQGRTDEQQRQTICRTAFPVVVFRFEQVRHVQARYPKSGEHTFPKPCPSAPLTRKSPSGFSHTT